MYIWKSTSTVYVLSGWQLKKLRSNYLHKGKGKDFLGGPVIKNPPANAGDMGSIPGLGRSHMPQGKSVHVPQLLSPRSRTRDHNYGT